MQAVDARKGKTVKAFRFAVGVNAGTLSQAVSHRLLIPRGAQATRSTMRVSEVVRCVMVVRRAKRCDSTGRGGTLVARPRRLGDIR